MGMLQLAGAVSGFGKGLQQGLQQTQQYMSQSMLLKERDEMEQRRNEITYGRELGMLQKKADIDANLMREREGIQQTNAKELKGIDQTNDLKKLEVGQSYTIDNNKQKQVDKIAEELRAQGYKKGEADYLAKLELQKLDVQEKIDIRKGKRQQAADDRKFQQEAGLKITEKTMDLQKPHGGAGVAGGEGKWDDTTKHRERVIAERIAYYKKKMEMSIPLTDEEKDDYEENVRQQNEMVNIQNKPKPGAVDIGKFDKFKGASPY